MGEEGRKPLNAQESKQALPVPRTAGTGDAIFKHQLQGEGVLVPKAVITGKAKTSIKTTMKRNHHVMPARRVGAMGGGAFF